jgi:hypothetical protein
MRFSPTTLVLSLSLAAIVLGCDDGDSPTAPNLETEHTVFGYGATQSACWEDLRRGTHPGGRSSELDRLDCDVWRIGVGSSIGLVEQCPSRARRSDGLCYYCTSTIICTR